MAEKYIGFTNAPNEIVMFSYKKNVVHVKANGRFIGKAIEFYEDDVLIANGELTDEANITDGVYSDSFLVTSDPNSYSSEKTYRAVADGEDIPIFLTDEYSITMSNLPSDLWLCLATGGEVDAASLVDGNLSISRTTTKTIKKYDTKLVPDELISSKIARSADVAKAVAKADAKADNAQVTADNAQTAADNAQTAADNAQTAADNAQTAADNAIGADVIKGNYILREGIGDYLTPGFLVIYKNPTTAEETLQSQLLDSQIVLGPQSDYKFSASPSQVVLGKKELNNYIQLNENHGSSQSTKISLCKGGVLTTIDNTGEINCPNNTLFIYGSSVSGGSAIILHSSTPNSSKRFKITVDDTGTLGATEVT